MVLLNVQVKKQINRNGFIHGICFMGEFSMACLTLHICISKITEVQFFIIFFYFYFLDLTDIYLPQPETLEYVIYNINILKKKHAYFPPGQINVLKKTHKKEACGSLPLLSNGPFWTLVSQHRKKVKGFSRNKSTHCATALHFVFWQCQVLGLASVCFPSLCKPIPVFLILISQRFIKNAI